MSLINAAAAGPRRPEMPSGVDVALAVLSALYDEYTLWMTRDPLLQPSVDYLWRRYHNLIPAAIRRGVDTAGLEEVLVRIAAKHHGQVEAQARSGYTPRTLDLLLVLLCQEGLAALDRQEKSANFAGRPRRRARAPQRHDRGH